MTERKHGGLSPEIFFWNQSNGKPMFLQLEGGGDLVQFSRVFNLGKCILFLKC